MTPTITIKRLNKVSSTSKGKPIFRMASEHSPMLFLSATHNVDADLVVPLMMTTLLELTARVAKSGTGTFVETAV